jgi:hypothetical protein
MVVLKEHKDNIGNSVDCDDKKIDKDKHLGAIPAEDYYFSGMIVQGQSHKLKQFQIGNSDPETRFQWKEATYKEH